MGAKKYRIISNAVGSPQMVIDISNGKIESEYEFDEFGHLDKSKGKELLPFGFAGGLYDKDTKLVHFGARDYDPEIGRWIQKDPVGFSKGELNLYGYVLNDPINGIDPTGKFTFTFPLAAGRFLLEGVRGAALLYTRSIYERLFGEDIYADVFQKEADEFLKEKWQEFIETPYIWDPEYGGPNGAEGPQCPIRRSI